MLYSIHSTQLMLATSLDMCNPKPPSLISSNNTTSNNNNHNNNSNKTQSLNPFKSSMDPPSHDHHQQLHRWPNASEALQEIKEIGKISGPTAITGLILYSRAMISMLFLGYLGELELAGGSLAIGVANITGYSVISGLAMGMEPICGQAYGARQMKLLGLTLQRTVLLLLTVCIPISFMWLNMERILIWCNQDREISSVAQTFIVFAIPDLFVLSLLHPLRIYLRTQGVTLPVTWCSLASVAVHVPLNFVLVRFFGLGIAGVALAMAFTNLNLVVLLCLYVYFSGVYEDSYVPPGIECLTGWSSLLSLAIPNCVSVCLEWWWYELMIMLCGLLANPRATVASMGILIQTTSLVYVFPSSLSLGVSTRVSNELGARRPARARVSAIVALACAGAMGLGAMAFMTVVRRHWGRLFTTDLEILELTAAALPIAGVCELGNCPQTTGCGVLRGSARPTVGAHINLGSFYLVGMPVAFLMGFVVKLGFPGLWLGLLAAQGSCAVRMLIVLWRTDWEAQVDRAAELTASDGGASLLPVLDESGGDCKKTTNGNIPIVHHHQNPDEILCASGDEEEDSMEESDALII